MSRTLILLPALALPLVLALVPAGCTKSNATLPTTRLDPETLVATISHGETVDLGEHLVPGTWTLLEFGADW